MFIDWHPWNRLPAIVPSRASWTSYALANAVTTIMKESLVSSAVTMPTDQKAQKTKPDPDEVTLKIVLWSTQALFESRNALPERTFEQVFESGKKLLRRTQSDASVR